MRSRLSAAGRCVAASLLCAFAAAAVAADPASARGSMTIAGERIALMHAAAVERDNAEGLLDSPNELRIALTDRELSPEMLWGIAFLPATTMASEGKLRGLLIRVDPANRNRAVVTLLAQPRQPGESLANVTIESSAGARPALKVGSVRLPSARMRATAKLFGEPVAELE